MEMEGSIILDSSDSRYTGQSIVLRYNIPNQVVLVYTLHLMTKLTITIVKLLFERWYTLHDKTYHSSMFNQIPHNSILLCESYTISLYSIQYRHLSTLLPDVVCGMSCSTSR
jgi:hypothetical protein